MCRHQKGASARRIEGHIATQELTLRNVTFNATTAAHQGWSANLYTMATDLFPDHAIGSVIGFGGFGGAVGGMLVAPAVGYWLDFSHGAYGPVFIFAGAMYLIALGVIHLISPRFEKAHI